MPTTPSGAPTLRTAAACAASAAALLLAGCVPSPFTPPENSIYRLDVSDCMNGETQNRQFSDFTEVDCDRPHFGEIYARTGIAHETYPGHDELLDTAIRECGDRFESFVGIGHLMSEFEMRMAFPTESQWTLINDRKITCIAFDPAGETTGSLAGARR